MSGKETKEMVVPKENAVFRLDAHGRWHNKHGVFEHKKIIDYFHSSIRKDADGYHLFQKRGSHTTEKVYFTYEDTALFVFDIDEADGSDKIRLILNTKEKIPLDPKAVYIQNDNLYVTYDGHRIKFIDRAMLKLAHRLKFDQQQYRLEFSGKTYDIPIDGGNNPTKKD
ncbi:MAG: MFS transporter permease [Desulfobacterales bacterium]